MIVVIAYTNCDSVELFLNNKSFGKKTTVFPQQGHTRIWNKYDKPFISATTSDLHLSWDVPYEPGTLKFVGTKGGQVITEEIRTTVKPAAIRLSVDRKDIDADAWDIANVKVEVVDADGLVVPGSDNLIDVMVEGAGILLATDNGDPQDKTSMKTKQRKTFGGLALAIIQSTDKPGLIRVRATSENLTPLSYNLRHAKPITPRLEPRR